MIDLKSIQRPGSVLLKSFIAAKLEALANDKVGYLKIFINELDIS
jgi:hypothetical protein